MTADRNAKPACFCAKTNLQDELTNRFAGLMVAAEMQSNSVPAMVIIAIMISSGSGQG